MKIFNKSVAVVALFSLSSIFSGCKDEEIIINTIKPSAGKTLTLSGISSTEAGLNAKNSVFVDMSKDLQTSVLRSGWDLGFYCGSDFKVILNHSTGATAIQVNKTDLNDVTFADVKALPKDSTSFEFGTAGIGTVDPVTGSFTNYLAGTVWKDVALADNDNKIFIINRGTSGDIEERKLMKVQVTRSGTGYLVKYDNIRSTATVPRTATIVKDASYNFKFLSFESASTLSIEPAKKLWDIEYTISTYKDAAGLPATEPDFVLINFANGVTAAEIVFGTDQTKNYASFTSANLSGVIFSGDRDVIGVKWRTLTGSTSTSLNINNDRFYLVKDPDGNIYKLKFNGGLRGKPEIQYELVPPVPLT